MFECVELIAPVGVVSIGAGTLETPPTTLSNVFFESFSVTGFDFLMFCLLKGFFMFSYFRADVRSSARSNLN